MSLHESSEKRMISKVDDWNKIDDEYKQSEKIKPVLTATRWISFFLGLLTLALFGAFKQKENLKKLEPVIKQKNEEVKIFENNFSKLIYAGKYIAGHPDIPNSLSNFTIGLKGNDVLLIQNIPNQNPVIPMERKVLTKINYDSIQNIVIEDASTVEKRVTATRFLAFGVFAFAAQKTTKTSLHYVIIE